MLSNSGRIKIATISSGRPFFPFCTSIRVVLNLISFSVLKPLKVFLFRGRSSPLFILSSPARTSFLASGFFQTSLNAVLAVLVFKL